jgi:16S rRNA G966 N2-methylase RsmD
MFKILARRVRAGRILDLCSGCGTVGIEAISRGAMLTTFVDRSGRMSSFLRANLKEFAIKDGQGEVFEIEALPFLMRAAKRKRTWDVAFYGVPSDDASEQIVSFLGRGRTITPEGIVVIEHRNDLPERLGRLRRWRTITHEGVTLSFYEIAV